MSKSNEITAIPTLLDVLDIEGSIITIDAMGTQKKIADKIHKANGDYILALKANHPTLFQDVKTHFDSLQIANTLPLPLERYCAVQHVLPHTLSSISDTSIENLCKHLDE
jgi:hypothetical protein